MPLFTRTRRERAEKLQKSGVTLAQRTYLTRDGKAVAANHKDRHTLLGAEGKVIPRAKADAAGVPTGKLGEKKPAAKKAATPAKNKQATPARNKSAARKPARKK